MSVREEWKSDYMKEIWQAKRNFIKVSHIKMKILLIASLCLFNYQVYSNIIGNFTSRNSKIFLVELLILGLVYIRFAESKLNKYEQMEREFDGDMLDLLHYRVMKFHLVNVNVLKKMADRLEDIENNSEKISDNSK